MDFDRESSLGENCLSVTTTLKDNSNNGASDSQQGYFSYQLNIGASVLGIEHTLVCQNVVTKGMLMTTYTLHGTLIVTSDRVNVL